MKFNKVTTIKSMFESICFYFISLSDHTEDIVSLIKLQTIKTTLFFNPEISFLLIVFEIYNIFTFSDLIDDRNYKWISYKRKYIFLKYKNIGIYEKIVISLRRINNNSKKYTFLDSLRKNAF